MGFEYIKGFYFNKLMICLVAEYY